MSKHTEGPWRIEEGVHYACIRTDSGVIADMRFVGGAVRNMADARLIAAAPELLEACKAMIEWDDREKDHTVDFQSRMALCEQAFNLARAAIAKAIGENNE